MIADFLITPNQECIDLLNNEISIINLASGYSSGYMNFGQGAPDVDLDLGNLSAIYNEIGEFTISQVVTNELGCMDSLSQTICVKNVVRVYMPNIFSPDGDGVNDRFEVGAIGIDNYEISIYNRWGNLVFRSNDIDDSWDGKFQGEYVMAGVYTVLISFEDQETGELERKAMGLTVVR
jgi:gliding motility-associated-like protein